MKILIVEDEKSLRDSIAEYLSAQQYITEAAANFDQALEKAMIYNYDCIIVDIMLPDGNGLDLITELKKTNRTSGIIIISAKGSVEERIAGLETGSDDYLTKPFHLSELNARIRSLLRRKNFNGSKDIVFQEIIVNTDNREVTINDSALVLTSKEYDLLLFFIANKNRVIPKDSIAEHLWGSHMDQADSFDFIYTHIKNLRKKLISAGSKDYLKTVYGIGYKFSAE